MKVDDFVHKFSDYALSDSFESTKMCVLSRFFFLYSGINVAYTKNPLKGGYLVQSEYTRKGKRKFNRNYNSEKCKKELTFGEPAEFAYPSTLNNLFVRIYNNNTFMQPDWLEAMNQLAKECLLYFMDSERVKTHRYYPSDELINKEHIAFKDGCVQRLRKAWGYEESYNAPTIEECTKHCIVTFLKVKKEMIDFFSKFLNLTVNVKHKKTGDVFTYFGEGYINDDRISFFGDSLCKSGYYTDECGFTFEPVLPIYIMYIYDYKNTCSILEYSKTIGIDMWYGISSTVYCKTKPELFEQILSYMKDKSIEYKRILD